MREKLYAAPNKRAALDLAAYGGRHFTPNDREKRFQTMPLLNLFAKEENSARDLPETASRSILELPGN